MLPKRRFPSPLWAGPTWKNSRRKFPPRSSPRKIPPRARSCGLFTGQPECDVCATPLSAAERNRITIQRNGDVTTIARVTCPTAPKFWRWRDLPFPRLEVKTMEIHDDDEHDHHADEWKWQLALAVVCGVAGLLAAFVVPAPYKVFAFCVAYLAGGFFPAEEVWERLQKRILDVHFLMIAVAVGAACIGAWAEGATLLFLFSFSGALEHYAMGRTQREIRSLFRDAPKTATVIDANGNETEVPVEKILKGARLLIKPGAQFPVDAEIAKGSTAADESNLTGEATPVEKNVGDGTLAGTINLWGAVEVVVTRPAAEKLAAKNHQAHQGRAAAKSARATVRRQVQRLLHLRRAWSFARDVFRVVAGLQARAVHFQRGGTQRFLSHHDAARRLVAVRALVLSIPSAVLAAIAWAARHGILVSRWCGGGKTRRDQLRLPRQDRHAHDWRTARGKSGKLSRRTRKKELAQLAYSIEKLSTHPLARAITLYGKHQRLDAVEFTDFESVTGQGLKAKRNGVECLLGRREWIISERRAPVRPEFVFSRGGATAPGFSEIWLAAGDLLGRIILRDDIRPQAATVINELRAEGLKSVVLTGDRKAAAEHLRSELKLDDIRAELKPEQKVAAIQELSGQGKLVAMVGDGVNDAPSLAVAHIGVAMGARGADAALEQADVVLMNDKLENFLAAFRLSQRARRIIRQNLFISLGTVIVLVSFAMVGKIPLTIGVVGHEGSTVIVVMNSLRLLFGSGKK